MTNLYVACIFFLHYLYILRKYEPFENADQQAYSLFSKY